MSLQNETPSYNNLVSMMTMFLDCNLLQVALGEERGVAEACVQDAAASYARDPFGHGSFVGVSNGYLKDFINFFAGSFVCWPLV